MQRRTFLRLGLAAAGAAVLAGDAVTVTRRALLARGGSGSFPVAPAAFEVSAAPSGGWTQVQLDRAVHYGGYTYYGYHDGQSGDNELRWYRHSDGVTGSAITIKAGIGGVEGSPDSHAAPVLLIRDSDHKLLVFYSGHATSQLWLRVSTTSLDTDPVLGDGFAAETNLDSSLGKTQYTYPSAFQLTGVTNDPIYLFFRDTQGSGGSETSVMCMSVSTNGGATWGAAIEVFKRANYLPYWVIDSDMDSRIDVFLIDGTGTALGGAESPVKGYHFWYDGTTWRESDGTSMGSPTFGIADLTEIYDGSDGDVAHAWDINTNGGFPVILVPIDVGLDCRYDYCRWTGSAWVTNTITTAIATGGGGTAGLCFDHSDPTVVYLMDAIAAAWELYRYWTADGGATWSSVAITSGGGGNNAPTRIRNRANDLRVLWWKGSAPTYLSYDVATMGSRR